LRRAADLVNRLINIKAVFRHKSRMLHVHKPMSLSWELGHSGDRGSARQCRIPGVMQ